MNLILFAWLVFAAFSQVAAGDRFPIVFHSSYDISLGLLDQLHSFDGQKYGKIKNALDGHPRIQFHAPEAMISDEELRKVHSAEYLKSLNASMNIAKIAEVYPLTFLPNFLLQWQILNPMRYATAGTVLAANLALQHGYAINLSGGYHHAKRANGEGFCFFADIPLAIKTVLEQHPDYRFLIIDLDAHQGNGHEMICGTDPALSDRVAIMDIYNRNAFPRDAAAKRFINYCWTIPPRETMIPCDSPIEAQTREYLDILRNELPTILDAERPNLIIYNAGTDILAGDPLGRMSISEDGIVERDDLVFRIAHASKIPIVMVLSGGYTPQSAFVTARSIQNIVDRVK